MVTFDIIEKNQQLSWPLNRSRSQSLDSESTVTDSSPPKQVTIRQPRPWKIVFIPLGLVLGVVLFVSGVIVGSQQCSEASCAALTTQWSPLLRDVEVRFREKDFDGDFHNENIYRKAPSPEVDAAWEDLGVDYRAGIISYNDGLASGLDPSFVQRSEEYGGGFLVNVEGMHHLHCLNLVRKSLYFNHGYYEALGTNEFLNNGTMLEHHITHCLDTVRQVLMCNVDTAVLGQRWVDKDEPYGFPDFQTTHQCKNYDDVRRWAEKLQAPPTDELPKDYLATPKPGDVLDVPP